ATSQGNSSLSKTISIATIITTLPSISSYNIFPYSVINGSNALIGISAENADNLYAIITLPNGTAENLALTNDANATLTNTSLIGRYNITLFANNSQGIDNVSDYFESFVPIQFAFRVINFNTTGLNSSWEFYYRGAIIKSNGSSEGTHLSEFPDTLVEIKFKSYSDRLHTTLRGINASLENNKSLGMDKLLTPAPEYLLTYGINNSYNFTNATIRIYYDDIPFTNEGNLKFDKCDDWDFVNQACSGSFNDVTSSAVQNTLENYFEYETTSFSGFGIREVISSGDTGGSTGGGGGGSSCTYNQSYDWQCGVWGSCINGKQIRTCKTTNNCGNTFGRPETNQSCVFLSPKIPEELFDITLELESSAITNSNELATRIIFASFGTIPTHVDLTYVILDSTGNEVYREKGETIVETEAVLSKRFENLQLGDGRYSLILTTLYGDNVTDQFRQEFSVEEEKKISWWIWIAWALIVLILVWILIYYLARKLRKPKIKIVKYSEWKKQQTNRLLDGTKNIQGLENNFFRRMLKILKGGKI
ncbi:hypothetical protein HYV50_01340, partial [Candidatus Pacearchaeota archaeon]|nr:hypothetical protein [Candidatus Pacearchaeota archaeon]